MKKKAVVIPNAAKIYGQLLESTLSLPRGRNGTEFYAFTGDKRYNLEPMRGFRPSNVYTVRYLNEQNAVRQRLSAVQTIFEYDFQNYDTSLDYFSYSCLVFEITEANEGVFDSIGLWFDLFLDPNREDIVTNAPNFGNDTSGLAPCWMQAVYRTNRDVSVKKNDIVRIQVVQKEDIYIFGNVGVGQSNENSRLLRIITNDCTNPVYVYSYRDSEYEEIDLMDAMEKEGDDVREYLVGTINPPQKWNVFQGQVFQRFKFVTQTKSGKFNAMWYQLPDSTSQIEGSKEDKQRYKLPLDTYEITCP